MTEIVYFKTNTGYVASVSAAVIGDGAVIITDKDDTGCLILNGIEVPLIKGRAQLPREVVKDGKNTVFLNTGTGYIALEPFEVHGKAITFAPLSDAHFRELLSTYTALEKRLSSAEKKLADHSAKIDSTIF